MFVFSIFIDFKNLLQSFESMVNPVDVSITPIVVKDLMPRQFHGVTVLDLLSTFTELRSAFPGGPNSIHIQL